MKQFSSCQVTLRSATQYQSELYCREFVLAFLTLVICLLGLAMWPVPSRAEENEFAPKFEAEIADLIYQLGSPSYAERERATDRLREIGLPAKEHLLGAVDSLDAEVSHRSRRLLVSVLAEDFDARVEAFAADVQGELNHSLPGWDSFQALVGSDPTSRALFVEMLRTEPLLLETIDLQPEKLKQMLVNRCDQMYDTMRRPNVVGNRQVTMTFSLGSITTLYFIAAQPDVNIDNDLANKINQIMHRSPMRQEIVAGEYTSSVRRLIGAWIVASADSSMAYQNLWMALQYDLKEGLVPAKHLISTNGAGSSIMPTAILGVAKLGGQEERPTLLKLIDKDEVVRTYSRNGRRLTCQTRDVALLALLHLDGQDPKEFGFDHVQAYPQTLYQVGTIGFEDAAQRNAAFEKWNQHQRAVQEKQQANAEAVDD